jgi:ketosteroid isomerase-like protein
VISVKRAEMPGDLHPLFAQALNSGDVDALVDLYATDGFLMAQRDTAARGSAEIRAALAQYVAAQSRIELTTRKVVQAGDTALLIGDWHFRRMENDGREVLSSGTSIEVGCRQPDGRWCYLIDLPYGLDQFSAG